MKIVVYGSGCATCKRLFELTKKAVEEMDLKDNVDYITGDIGVQKIIELGLMQSPVLVVNDKVAMTGYTSDIQKIKDAIQDTS